VALNIKNVRVERLASEVAAITGESKTEVIYQALLKRKKQLVFQVAPQNRAAKLRDFLESEVWKVVPKRLLGKQLTREQEDEILGYGPRGV
jgi:antitoxin VapB